MTDQNLERRLRYALEKEGYKLQKSRARRPYLEDRGGYRIVQANGPWVARGRCFELTLDGVAAFLEEVQG